VIERALMPDELDRADEVFVTGTAAEVTPVGEIEGKKFKVGPITQALREDYSKLVRQPPKAAAAE
jgi:branched-chain amino acid aminotransferase